MVRRYLGHMTDPRSRRDQSQSAALSRACALGIRLSDEKPGRLQKPGTQGMARDCGQHRDDC
ncbi:unnamed protein product [Staurois parvus]|uniref:Integrase n=1 Tax=Staurois parvus TaxID=386267 RepID=A0ABN9G642_9NEOB|nr:unnamed protein product [Staurois parvus]